MWAEQKRNVSEIASAEVKSECMNNMRKMLFQPYDVGITSGGSPVQFREFLSTFLKSSTWEGGTTVTCAPEALSACTVVWCGVVCSSVCLKNKTIANDPNTINL